MNHSTQNPGNFKSGYGSFPYVILRVNNLLFMQIPIHFLGEDEPINLEKHPGAHLSNISPKILNKSKDQQIRLLHDRLIELTVKIYNKIEKDRGIAPKLCLVEGPNKAFFYQNKEFKESITIPSGGALINQQHELIAMGRAHFHED